MTGVPLYDLVVVVACVAALTLTGRMVVGIKSSELSRVACLVCWRMGRAYASPGAGFELVEVTKEQRRGRLNQWTLPTQLRMQSPTS